MTPDLCLATDRLLLVPHRLEDFDDYRTFWAPGQIDVPGPPPLGHEESWQRLMRMIGQWHALGCGMFVVRERATDRIVGEAGIGRFERNMGESFDNAPEAGWKIAVDCWGRGYAGEAMDIAYRWFDRAFDIQRTMCMIDPDNAPSLRVAERLGFTGAGEGHYRDKPILLFERLRPPA